MGGMAEPTRTRHALFPGTFDPFTLGHLDLVERAVRLFGRATVGVARNAEKRSLFQPEERAELARAALSGIAGADVALVPGLVVRACEELGADVIVRGVRGGSDLELEIQMARTNRTLAPRIDTVLLVPSPALAHVSSTLVREIAALGGDVSPFVPKNVAEALRARFAGGRS
jgi:pantetheine-phosphate adenylyltransferase